MKIKLPSTIASSQDLASLINEIHEYSKWFAHESIKKKIEVKNTQSAPVLSTAASTLLRLILTPKSTQKDIDDLIKILEQYRRKSSTIAITLAAPANNSVKEKLVDWCRENIADDILVNFYFNSTLLGGMIVRYGSRIFDWSFRRQILANRNRFPEILTHV